jgi:hypothetical protein
VAIFAGGDQKDRSLPAIRDHHPMPALNEPQEQSELAPHRATADPHFKCHVAPHAKPRKTAKLLFSAVISSSESLPITDVARSRRMLVSFSTITQLG